MSWADKRDPDDIDDNARTYDISTTGLAKARQWLMRIRQWWIAR